MQVWTRFHSYKNAETEAGKRKRPQLGRDIARISQKASVGTSADTWSLDIHGLEMLLKRSGKRQRPNPDCANFVKDPDSKPSSRLDHSIYNRSLPAKSLHSRDSACFHAGPVENVSR